MTFLFLEVVRLQYAGEVGKFITLWGCSVPIIIKKSDEFWRSSYSKNKYKEAFLRHGVVEGKVETMFKYMHFTITKENIDKDVSVGSISGNRNSESPTEE